MIRSVSDCDIIDPDINFLSVVPCSYYNPQSFNEEFSDVTDCLVIVHQNIRSFNCNFDEFSIYLNTLNVHVDVVILSETWFGVDGVQSVVGYRDYHSCRTDKRGGGVSLYVSNHLKSKINSDLTFNSHIAEFCSVDISTLSQQKFNVTGFYRPPDSAAIIPFCDLLRDKILASFSPSQKVLLGGDANINLLSNDASANVYVNLFRSSYFLPYITVPTRVTDSTATLVDHIWSNVIIDVKAGVFTSDITDHFMSFACLLHKKVESNVVKRTFRDCSQRCIDRLKVEISNSLLTFHVYDSLDVNLRTSIFCKIFWNAYNISCPIRVKYISKARLMKPWFSGDLVRLCNLKHELFRRYRSGEIDYSVYRVNKNKFTASLKKAKINYFRNKFDMCRNDMKSTWCNIRKILGNGGRRQVEKLVNGDVTVRGPAEIPGVFNDFFASIAIKLRNDIPVGVSSPLDYMGVPSPFSLDAELVSELEVFRMISSLANKSGRLNTIPVFIFKALNDVISPVICNLFNSSLLEGSFPDVLKVAEVIPIHKSGSLVDVSNYRPISTLPVLSKVFERLMRVRLLSFFDQHSTLSEHQFGFRLGHETGDAILEFLDCCYKSLDAKKHLISIFLDLSKAFDTIDHEILLAKLNHVGVRGRVLEWLTSYLCRRKQFVTVDAHSSGVLDIYTGVPQGSVLGPLLFLVFINDMSCSSDIINFVHFADDTTLFVSGEDLGVLRGTVNEELVRIDNWLIANKLSLNVNKTTFMVFSHSHIPNDLTIQIRGLCLERVNVTKFLGVYIDDKLIFKSHIDHVCGKVSKSLGILYKLTSYVPCDVLLSLYYSLVHSHFIYALTSWGGSAAIHMEKLNVLQRRAIKLLPREHDFSNILTVDNLYKYFCGIKLFRSVRLGIHDYFCVQYGQLFPDHEYATRHRSDNCLNVPLSTKSRSQNSFLYKSSKSWNLIPYHVRNSSSLGAFKQLYKSHLLTS